MIIDTSALIAILRDESEAKGSATEIETAPVRRLSAASFAETALVIDGSRDPIASRRSDDLVKKARVMLNQSLKRRRESREAYSAIIATKFFTEIGEEGIWRKRKNQNPRSVT